jgi:hypothetical protein
MSEPLLVDTGPIVAILSPKDPYHHQCFEIARNRTSPLLTCWPVVTEAAWLLGKVPTGVTRLLQSIVQGLCEIVDHDRGAAPWLLEFTEKYADLGVQVADASLVYLAE